MCMPDGRPTTRFATTRDAVIMSAQSANGFIKIFIAIPRTDADFFSLGANYRVIAAVIPLLVHSACSF